MTISNEELLKHAEANPIPQSWYDEEPQTPPVKKQYSVERIQALLAELAEFDSHKLTDIELLQNGEVINIPLEVIEEFKFVGLNNTSFIEFEYWMSHSDLFAGEL